MTVIAVRAGVMAADSRVTVDSEAGGIRVYHCQKMYKQEGEYVIGVSGDGYAALRFVEWFRTPPKKGKKKRRDDILALADTEFTALVYYKDGKLEEYDRMLVPEEIELGETNFYAIGCGTKIALGAMDMGATAARAVEIACRWDPFCALPVIEVPLSTL